MESSEDDSGSESHGNRYDDAEDDVEINYHTYYKQEDTENEESGDDDQEDSGSESDDNDEDEAEEAMEVEAMDVEPVRPAVGGGARGKPEAMAVALAASKIDEVKEELEAEKQQQQQDITIAVEATAVVAEPLVEASMEARAVDAQATPVAEVQISSEAPVSSEVKPTPTTKKKRKPAPKKTATGSSGKKATKEPSAPSLDDPVPPITDVEYENLATLMEQFCKVPLLAEFSRPVTLLHPELMPQYSKIVKHPIDLGKVCRKIRRRQYKNVREVQLDAWRIFSNCIKYQSHPSNKESVPSFVSIALHLREFWNNLWQEYMLASDSPKEVSTGKSATSKYLKESYATRDEDRRRRLIVSGLTCMSMACMKRSSEKIRLFIANQGRVDRLDPDPIFPGEDPFGKDIDSDDRRDLQIVVDRLVGFRTKLLQMAADNAEYTVEQFDADMKSCYQSEDLFENNSALKFRVRNRFNRFVGKILVPINEANCRGITQSSIWGCMAAAIWARENSKKPFWPALVLGILAPDDQKEDWHWALTERNEQRLPEALRTQLAAGKRKAEQALKRQSQGQADPQSFFLVEFLGTHEFIWVRETDIVESFEPEDDPNLKIPANKKKRGGNRAVNAAVTTSKKYQGAIEEAGWALEEFEMQLQDACGDTGDDEDGEDANYSYAVLCVSDDEADDAADDDVEMTLSEVEEAHELIATRGLIDFSVAGRKKAKQRREALKKKKIDEEKKEKLEKDKKRKAEQAKKKRKDSAAAKNKEREVKKEQRDLEKRRKKRSREREKALKSNKKLKRTSLPSDQDQKRSEGGLLLTDKRARATALVKGYLTRMAADEEKRSLGLQGVLSIPAAMIDSTGILGMALAFRAAAGELAMPDESGDQETVKPWDAIVVDESMTETQRIEALQKQVKLLQAEIHRVKSATAKRLELAKEAELVRKKLDEEIFKDEQVARLNPFAKRKGPGGGPGGGGGKKSKSTDNSPAESKSDIGTENDNDDATKGTSEAGADDSMIDLGSSHVKDSPSRPSLAAGGESEDD